VNPTLAAAFLRQRLTSPIRMGLLFLLATFPLGAAVITGTLSPLGGIAGPLALILAAGAVGQDVSSGTLQLLLVRPVSRPSLVVSRWLAATLAATAIVVALLVLATLAMVVRGTHPDALDLIRMVLEAACNAAGSAAVILMLSTLVGGLGDVALYMAALFVGQMFSTLAEFKHWDWLSRACEELQGALMPTLSWAWLVFHAPPSWFALASWASTVTLALAVGIARLNRRELSYAAD